MEQLLIVLLEFAGLLLLAAGAAAALFPLIGWPCVAAAGVVLLAGAWIAEWKPKSERGR